MEEMETGNGCLQTRAWNSEIGHFFPRPVFAAEKLRIVLVTDGAGGDFGMDTTLNTADPPEPTDEYLLGMVTKMLDSRFGKGIIFEARGFVFSASIHVAASPYARFLTSGCPFIFLLAGHSRRACGRRRPPLPRAHRLDRQRPQPPIPLSLPPLHPFRFGDGPPSRFPAQPPAERAPRGRRPRRARGLRPCRPGQRLRRRGRGPAPVGGALLLMRTLRIVESWWEGRGLSLFSLFLCTRGGRIKSLFVSTGAAKFPRSRNSHPRPHLPLDPHPRTAPPPGPPLLTAA